MVLRKRADDMQGFLTGPDDPIENFAFVGTRYAYRATKAMMNVLRKEGFDDLFRNTYPLRTLRTIFQHM